MIEVRTATIDDAKALAKVEGASFPPAEACSLDNFKKRLSVFADYFLVLERDLWDYTFFCIVYGNKPSVITYLENKI